MKNIKYKTSICMITYNHEKYIAQAIEGILSQIVNFDYEIVIGEDCSTDNTRKIVTEYAKKYPEKFKLLLPEKNLGMMKNFINTHKACSGEYVALCEGDDYWTNPHKLQKQVDFLEQNSNYTITSHNVDVIYGNTNKANGKWFYTDKERGFTLEDILRGETSPTCSLLYRNEVFEEFPDWVEKQAGADGSIQVLCTEKGKMKYFPETMGAYRIHETGAYSARVKEAKEKNIDLTKYLYDNATKCLDAFDKHLNYKYTKLLDIKRRYNDYNAFSGYALSGDFKNANQFAKKLLKNVYKLSPKTTLNIVIKILIINSLPKKIALKVWKYFNKK